MAYFNYPNLQNPTTTNPTVVKQTTKRKKPMIALAVGKRKLNPQEIAIKKNKREALLEAKRNLKKQFLQTKEKEHKEETTSKNKYKLEQGRTEDPRLTTVERPISELFMPFMSGIALSEKTQKQKDEEEFESLWKKNKKEILGSESEPSDIDDEEYKSGFETQMDKQYRKFMREHGQDPDAENKFKEKKKRALKRYQESIFGKGINDDDILYFLEEELTFLGIN